MKKNWPSLRAGLAALALVLTGLGFAQSRPHQELPYVAPKRWALVIGAEKYQEYSPLQFAADDARAVAKTLIDGYRFDPSTVSVLADDDQGPQPTVANIRAKLDEKLANPQLDRGDLFVFYFSGHGAGGQQGDFLLPTDTKKANFEAQGLPIRELIERIVKAGLKNVLIVTDACRSGQENSFGTELQELGRKANIAVILGCAPGTRSYEYPNFGRGIFTHFLLRALSQQEPKEPGTGALWVSAIAKRVQKEVADRTERDYGVNLQRPAIWSEPTQDVLIGAFVPAAFDAERLKSFEEQAAKLNQKDYGKALATFAEALYIQDRYGEAIQLLKTLDGIGEMTPAERYTYAMSLRFAERHTEAVRAFAELEKTPDSVYANLAVASNPSRLMPAARRIAAAKALWENKHDPDMAILAMAVIQQLGDDQTLATFLDDVLQADVLDPHRQAFARAAQAVARGKNAEAIAAYEEAAKGEGSLSEAARLWLWTLYRAQNQTDKLDELVRGVKDDEATWLYMAAKHRLEQGKQAEFFDLARRSLVAGPHPEILQALIREGGLEMLRFADEIIVAADRHPYSWRAILIKAFAESVKTPAEQRQGKAMERLAEALKYADDPLGAFATMVELLDPLLEEARQKGTIDDVQHAMLTMAYSGALILEVPQMGQDANLLFTTTYMSLRAQRGVQLVARIRAALGARIRDLSLAPGARATLLLAAMAAGDDELVTQLLAGRLETYDQHDVPLFHAMYLVGRQRDAEALPLIKAAQTPSRELIPLAEALRGYADALEGRRAEAERRAKAIDVTDPGLAAIKVLTLKKLGLPYADALVHATATETWRYLPVCFRVIREELADPKLAEADRIRLMLPLTAHTGNPQVDGLSFVLGSKVADFAGTYRTRSVVWDDEMTQAALDFEMVVSEDGKSTGKLGEISFSGQVSDSGTLAGTADYLGKKWSISSKLVPPALADRVEGIRKFGFLFSLMTQDGIRIAAYLVREAPRS